MANSNTDPAILRPEEVESLVVQPFVDQARATRVSTVVRSQSSESRFPVVGQDPSASWVAEGAEIPLSNPATSEVTVVPRKLAGLTVISSELAADSTPSAARVVGDGLTRDLARKADQAFYSDVATADPDAPSGLESLTGTGTVALTATSWSDLDPFAQAISQAETEGETVTSFVANPADALALAQLKEDSSDSNVPLLGSDPATPTAKTVFGVPLITSRAVNVGTVWGIPRNVVFTVIRKDVDLRRDESAYFSSDQVAIRAIMRVAFGFPHEAAIQKITLS